MFKDVPDLTEQKDPLGWLIAQMDKHNIARVMTGCSGHPGMHDEARKRFPDRFFFEVSTDPNGGVDEIRRIRKLVKQYDAKAVSVFPCGCNPQVPINDKRLFVTYAACVEMDIPIFVNVGVPGP